jgi:hypothetical protein
MTTKNKNKPIYDIGIKPSNVKKNAEYLSKAYKDMLNSFLEVVANCYDEGNLDKVAKHLVKTYGEKHPIYDILHDALDVHLKVIDDITAEQLVKDDNDIACIENLETGKVYVSDNKGSIH